MPDESESDYDGIGEAEVISARYVPPFAKVSTSPTNGPAGKPFAAGDAP